MTMRHMALAALALAACTGGRAQETDESRARTPVVVRSAQVIDTTLAECGYQ